MRLRRLQGIETEYGFAILPRRRSNDTEGVVYELMAGLAGRLPSLPPLHGSGLFLANGARAYIDTGLHPEFCTPEVESPFEAVRYVLAGDRLLQEVASSWSATQAGRRRMVLFKTNIDYAAGTTWACHESYSHRTDPRGLSRQLLPHLVSRVVYTGAGGLNPAPGSLEFRLSPRAYHLVSEVSSDSTGRRGIFHNKDESLAGDGWHRLHVLAGESLYSHHASVLKLGTTALILAMIEAGWCPGDAIQLGDPLGALEALNRDPACQTRVLLRDGRRLTAVQLQRHYLELAQARLEDDALPAWAPRLCQLWRETLDRLEQGPAAVATRLDWAIKYCVYIHHLAQRGASAADRERWSRALTAALRPPPSLANPMPGDLDSLLERLGAEEEARENIVPPGFTEDQARHFHQLRAELAELDVRFAELGGAGLFETLDRQGRLDHRVLPEITDDQVETAMREPPSRGRARVRAQFIRQLAGGPQQHGCDWNLIRAVDGRFLDLGNPLLDEPPAWQVPPPRPPSAAPPPGPTSLHPLIERALTAVKADYDRGFYERAWCRLADLRLQAHPLPPEAEPRVRTLTIWVQQRRGYQPQALALLETLRARQAMPTFPLILDFVALHRFGGMVPAEAIWAWIDQANALLAAPTEVDPIDRFAYAGHHGYALGRCGQLELALAVLEPLRHDSARATSNARLYARTLADLADVHRLRGQPSEARECLLLAEGVQRQGNYLGDLAELTLLNRAKLETDVRAVRAALDESYSLLLSNRHGMGLARHLLLAARLLSDPGANQGRRRELLRLEGELPALRACPVFQVIKANWDAWCAGSGPRRGPDPFAGL